MLVSKGELKKRALLAKQRMKMGYWQQLMDEREQLLSHAKTNERAALVSSVQRAEVAANQGIIVSNPAVNRDEALYKRVKLILDENRYALNPIGQLIDQEEYTKLDEDARQRYVLELSKKYKELKQRYLMERMAKNVQ